jgi:hypothetical protein
MMLDVILVSVGEGMAPEVIYWGPQESVVVKITGDHPMEPKIVGASADCGGWRMTMSGVAVYEVSILEASAWKMEHGISLQDYLKEQGRKAAIELGLHLEQYQDLAVFYVHIKEGNFVVTLHYTE